MTSRRGLFWPLLLIVIGLLFLLGNFGYLTPISFFALLSLWPVILILIGIDVAFGRRWPLPTLAVDLAIIVAAIAFVAVGPTTFPGAPFFVAEPNGDMSVSQPREGARSMTVRISGGAGTYNVSGATQDELLKATSTRADLHLRSSVRNGQADIRLDENATGFRFGPTFPGDVTATVASDIPTSLTVDVGAGDFTIDLTNVKVTDARINSGAASLHVTLPQPSGDVGMSISAGASSVVIDVPAGVEARIVTSGGLSSTRFDNPRFTNGETSGYAGAKDRVTLRVSTGASSVVVR